jgi:peptidoglycan/LPS O-acetylase OafA/YrhL
MLWTIAIEWQFYLLFPLLVPVLRSGWTRQVLGLVAVLLLFRGLAVLAGGNARDIGYMTILGRLDQFLIGMWAAWAFRTWPLSRRIGALLAGAALVVVVAALAVLNAAGGWPATPAWKIAWPTVEALLWAAFVIGYVAAANIASGLWSRVVARIGEISYSIYLIHFIVIWMLVRYDLPLAFTGRLAVDAVLETGLVALPVTLAIAGLTYHFVERPFLRLRGRYHRDAADSGAEIA